MLRPRAVMFDLDGTLLDTLAAISNAGNHALSELGHRPLPLDAFRFLAGQGQRYLVSHALQTNDESLITRGMEGYRTYYAEHGLEQTHVYPGVGALLDALRRRQFPLAVVSNKPHDATCAAVARFFGPTFAAVRGHTPGTALKPDPAAALQIAADLAIPPGQWLYLGDTRVDMLTGRAANMSAVGVTWGFRDEQELRQAGAAAIIHHPLDLLPLLDARPRRANW